MSQRSFTQEANVELIDLTNESSAAKNNHNHNTTITIDDSVVVCCTTTDDDDDDDAAVSQEDSDDDEQDETLKPSSQVSISRSQQRLSPEELDLISSSGSSSPAIISQVPGTPVALARRSPSPTLFSAFTPSPPSPPPSFRRRSLRHSTPQVTTCKPPPPSERVYDSPAVQNAHDRPLSREELKKQKLQQKHEERLEKEANRANAANKALDNCTANIDRNLLACINDPEEIALKTLFDESMLGYRLLEEAKVSNSVTWSIKRTQVLNNQCVATYKDSSWTIIVMPGSEYLTRMLDYKREPDGAHSIKTFLSGVRERTCCDVVLFVFNLSNHLKSERAKEAKNYRKTFQDRFEQRGQAMHADPASSDASDSTSATTSTSLGTTELQDLRLMLEMDFKRQHAKWKLHIEFYEKTQEVVQSLVRYTLSVARLEAKVKARASTGLDWAINMDKERPVDPTKSSEDLTKLWITQLQQFSQVTLPIAKAIAAEYPSPCLLLSQYRELTPAEAENLLAELHVQKNLRRQIGSNISRRVHRFLTCTDPEVHIGLS